MKELTQAEFLKGLLRVAQEAQKRRRVDEVDFLFDYCRRFPSSKLPPEIIRFLRSYKRPRGRLHSTKLLVENFWADPNRIAAHFAALEVAKIRKLQDGASKGRRPYKVVAASGVKQTVHELAVDRAVAFVNKSFAKISKRRARPESVKEMLRRGRVRRPTFERE